MAKRSVSLTYEGLARTVTLEEQERIFRDLEVIVKIPFLTYKIEDKQNLENDEQRMVKINRGNYSRLEGHVFVYHIIDSEIIEGVAYSRSEDKLTSLQIKELRQEDALKENGG